MTQPTRAQPMLPNSEMQQQHQHQQQQQLHQHQRYHQEQQLHLQMQQGQHQQQQQLQQLHGGASASAAASSSSAPRSASCPTEDLLDHGQVSFPDLVLMATANSSHPNLAIAADGSVAEMWKMPSKVPAACEHCRRRKARCSGSQPCGRCAKSGRPCIYKETEARRARLRHLLDQELTRRHRAAQLARFHQGGGGIAGGILSERLHPYDGGVAWSAAESAAQDAATAAAAASAAAAVSASGRGWSTTTGVHVNINAHANSSSPSTSGAVLTTSPLSPLPAHHDSHDGRQRGGFVPSLPAQTHTAPTTPCGSNFPASAPSSVPAVHGGSSGGSAGSRHARFSPQSEYFGQVSPLLPPQPSNTSVLPRATMSPSALAPPTPSWQQLEGPQSAPAYTTCFPEFEPQRHPQPSQPSQVEGEYGQHHHTQQHHYHHHHHPQQQHQHPASSPGPVSMPPPSGPSFAFDPATAEQQWNEWRRFSSQHAQDTFDFPVSSSATTSAAAHVEAPTMVPYGGADERQASLSQHQQQLPHAQHYVQQHTADYLPSSGQHQHQHGHHGFSNSSNGPVPSAESNAESFRAPPPPTLTLTMPSRQPSASIEASVTEHHQDDSYPYHPLHAVRPEYPRLSSSSSGNFGDQDHSAAAAAAAASSSHYPYDADDVALASSARAGNSTVGGAMQAPAAPRRQARFSDRTIDPTEPPPPQQQPLHTRRQYPPKLSTSSSSSSGQTPSAFATTMSPASCPTTPFRAPQQQPLVHPSFSLPASYDDQMSAGAGAGAASEDGRGGGAQRGHFSGGVGAGQANAPHAAAAGVAAAADPTTSSASAHASLPPPSPSEHDAPLQAGSRAGATGNTLPSSSPSSSSVSLTSIDPRQLSASRAAWHAPHHHHPFDAQQQQQQQRQQQRHARASVASHRDPRVDATLARQLGDVGAGIGGNDGGANDDEGGLAGHATGTVGTTQQQLDAAVEGFLRRASAHLEGGALLVDHFQGGGGGSGGDVGGDSTRADVDDGNSSCLVPTTATSGSDFADVSTTTTTTTTTQPPSLDERDVVVAHRLGLGHAGFHHDGTMLGGGQGGIHAHGDDGHAARGDKADVDACPSSSSSPRVRRQRRRLRQGGVDASPSASKRQPNATSVSGGDATTAPSLAPALAPPPRQRQPTTAYVKRSRRLTPRARGVAPGMAPLASSPSPFPIHLHGVQDDPRAGVRSSSGSSGGDGNDDDDDDEDDRGAVEDEGRGGAAAPEQATSGALAADDDDFFASLPSSPLGASDTPCPSPRGAGMAMRRPPL